MIEYMHNLVKETRHFGIAVGNMERSLHFYRDLLGLKIVRQMNESGEYINNMLSLDDVKVKTIKLSASEGKTIVELLEFNSHPVENKGRKIFDIGASHVAFTVSNLDECYNFLIKSGVKFNAPPQLSPDGYAKVTFCMDPDGTPVELVEVLTSE